MSISARLSVNVKLEQRRCKNYAIDFCLVLHVYIPLQMGVAVTVNKHKLTPEFSSA